MRDGRDYQILALRLQVPALAGRCGVSKSAAAPQRLCERCFDDVELLVICIAGKDFGGHQVVSEVGGRGGLCVKSACAEGEMSGVSLCVGPLSVG